MLAQILLLLYRIVLGLLGLGVVVFVHELGHFIAARLMGIGVEAFSIGWGKPILKKKIGEVEYRLGMLPLGGYCKMKGVADYGTAEYQEAYDNAQHGKVIGEKGSFLAAHPFRRIVTLFAGPLFNFIFAVIVLSLIWGAGFEVTALGNRIVLASDIVPGTNPADKAGLETGDRIVEVRGQRTETSDAIRRALATRPEENLPILVERDGQILDFSVTPALDKETGAGILGIHFWIDPVIERVAEGSPAEAAGLQSGDRIIAVNGENLPHTLALHSILQQSPTSLEVEFVRGGTTLSTSLTPLYGEDGAASLGIGWQLVQYQNPRLNPLKALAKGAEESWQMLGSSVKGLTLLFRGVDLTKAVSGPIRITYLVGDIAAEGFARSFVAGLSSTANFLALISIAIGLMNLLPLPVFDGGMIILFCIEAVRGKAPHPRVVSAFQTVGVVLIAALMIFAVFGDINYLRNLRN